MVAMPRSVNVNPSARDVEYMARALQLARRGELTARPNPQVGCVVVREDRVVGEGYHRRAGAPHAEVEALSGLDRSLTAGATVYVTLEPCCHHGRTPPCTETLVRAGVTRVVAAMQDPNPVVAGRGLAALRKAGIAAESGLMEAEARCLLAGFISRHERGRPRVLLKSATSLDGRTATASGHAKWITGPSARADVHRWRARAGAVVTGSGTVLADDPTLTARDVELPPDFEQPLRVVLDRRGRVAPSARLFTELSPVLLVAGSSAGADFPAHVELAAAVNSGPSCLPELLAELAQREINDVMVEAGPTLAGAFLHAGLVDEWLLYLNPRCLGGEALPALRLPGIDRVEDGPRMETIEIRKIGDDLRLRLRPLHEH